MTSIVSVVSSERSPYLTLGLSIAALVALYAGTALSTTEIWAKNPLGHGYFVIPVAAYFAWGARHELASARLTPTFWALPVLGLLAFVWLLGNLTSTDIVQQVCLVLMCIGFVWGVLGTPATRVLAFSLGLLLFALPLADGFVPMLQDFTARFAVRLLSLSGVPVLLQEHVISIPGSEWRVAEACSGINYLTSSLAVGYVYAGTTYRYWTHRIAFFAASALVPLVANGIRVYGTILVADLGGDGIAAGTRHYFFGWVVFGIMLAVLMFTCGNWQEQRLDAGPLSEGGTGARAPARRYSHLVFAVTALLVVGMAPLSASRYRLPISGDSRVVPAVTSLWVPVSGDAFGWTPRFAAPSSEVIQTYTAGNREVRVYVAQYSASQPGVKLATSANVLFEAPWAVTADRGAKAAVQGDWLTVREVSLQSPRSSLLVWSWYWVDGTSTSSDMVAKALLANARLSRSTRGAAAIAIATSDQDRRGAETLRKFLLDFSLTNVSLEAGL